jgi:hypothetical protein
MILGRGTAAGRVRRAGLAPKLMWIAAVNVCQHDPFRVLTRPRDLDARPQPVGDITCHRVETAQIRNIRRLPSGRTRNTPSHTNAPSPRSTLHPVFNACNRNVVDLPAT